MIEQTHAKTDMSIHCSINPCALQVVVAGSSGLLVKNEISAPVHPATDSHSINRWPCQHRDANANANSNKAAPNGTRRARGARGNVRAWVDSTHGRGGGRTRE